ncbi:protein POLR1D-like [Entelurus aequoreus]|uniref:protein POLR1D-like n=1 Tax=Entelurus aequoreus TaxID=161455 RepID=UPI002B1E8678|nr:protein POLR1D-like [Entelurus aequoreus]
MAKEENELEKRAIEELLRETDRARVRAETMGPAGWLKCPLRGANKRFLLNTLRSTGGLQRRGGEPKTSGQSSGRGHGGTGSPDRSRSRSRDRRRSSKRHHRSSRDGRQDVDGERERSGRHEDEREDMSKMDAHKKDKR